MKSARRMILGTLLMVFVSTIILTLIASATSASAATRKSHPSAPRNVTATARDTSAIVKFLPSASNGGSRITWYYVKVFGTNAPLHRCDTTRCLIIGLPNNVGYRFVVAAVNRFGRSAFSRPSNVATPQQPASSTITFNANGGSGTMASETEPYDTTAVLTLNSFTYTGYTFSDWNSKANGSGTSFTDGQLVKFNGSATFYAQWTVSATTATITFVANGGKGTMSPETETLGVSATLTTNSFTRTGYTFSDWNSEANGSGTSFTNGEVVQFTASATFYAQWTAVPTAQFTNTSVNWSGYVVPSSSALITDAQGDWTVPTVNCSDTPEGQVSIWIGIGGEQWSTGGDSGSLLQTGININCVDGFQDDVAWWEVVPATPNNEQDFTSFPVSPGDQIEASVYETTTGAWQTEVSDVNTGLSAYMITGESWGVGPTSSGDFAIQGSAAEISYGGGYTAEWIVEDPGIAATPGTYFPFANFGSVTFSNLESSFDSWSLSPSEEWGIVQGGVTLAAPTNTTSDGFTVTYTGP